MGKQRKLQALRHKVDKLCSLVGYQLLKTGLSQLGYPESALSSLNFSRQGKPRLPLPVDFSISHNGVFVVCVVSQSGPVGIDVEPWQQAQRTQLKNYFSSSELQQIATSPTRLAELWGQKEAVVKAAGDDGLAAISRVKLQNQSAQLDGTRWLTRRIECHPDYCCQLASQTTVAKVKIEPVNIT